MLTSIQCVELPVTLRPGRRWSDEELFAFCKKNDELRIERKASGTIVLMSPAGSASGGRNADLTVELGTWARQDGRGKSFDSSTGWTLPDGSMLSPDASWVSKGRWVALTKEQQRRFAPICPEFVVELLSPSDAVAATREKMQAWLANGAELGWMIDADARTVEVFRPGREPERVSGVDRLAADGPVAGFVLDLSLIWSE